MPPSSETSFRIAFDNICTKDWIGGCHYLKNLFNALKISDVNPELILCGEGSVDSAKILDQYITQHLKSPVHRFKLLNLAFKAEKRFDIPLGMSRLFASFLRKRGVDVMFTNSDEGPSFNIPLIAWIADFQHVHLPEMFSDKEIRIRNRAFLRASKRADRVILSSHNALEDFQRFAPEHAHKGRVINFVAQIDASIYDSNPNMVCERYQLPERFIYLPNQFWKHKNHQLVFKAVARLKAKGIDVKVVCSGNTTDYRNPDHFLELQAQIEGLKIQDKLIILGMIPHEHIFELMRQSIAVLQPSLFEGWSTSVEEAKSIGKRIILSDLAVHREQNPPSALFFDPLDAAALADCLQLTLEEASPGPDRVMEIDARENLPNRIKVFGESFMQICREIAPKS